MTTATIIILTALIVLAVGIALVCFTALALKYVDIIGKRADRALEEELNYITTRRMK